MKRESNIFTRKIKSFIAIYSAIVSIFTLNISSIEANVNSTITQRSNVDNVRVLSERRLEYYVPELPEVIQEETPQEVAEDSVEDYVQSNDESYVETEIEYEEYEEYYEYEDYEYVEDYSIDVCSEVEDEVYEPETYDLIDESSYTDDEIYLMAKVCLAEAEGETELGKRLVVSTILNRIDSGYYSNNVYDVVFQPYQFEVTMNGRLDRVTVTDDVIQLVKEEIQNRTSYEVIYFRTDHYSEYGTPLFQEDSHYFSAF